MRIKVILHIVIDSLRVLEMRLNIITKEKELLLTIIYELLLCQPIIQLHYQIFQGDQDRILTLASLKTLKVEIQKYLKQINTLNEIKLFNRNSDNLHQEHLIILLLMLLQKLKIHRIWILFLSHTKLLQNYCVLLMQTQRQRSVIF